MPHGSTMVTVTLGGTLRKNEHECRQSGRQDNTHTRQNWHNPFCFMESKNPHSLQIPLGKKNKGICSWLRPAPLQACLFQAHSFLLLGTTSNHIANSHQQVSNEFSGLPDLALQKNMCWVPHVSWGKGRCECTGAKPFENKLFGHNQYPN